MESVLCFLILFKSRVSPHPTRRCVITIQMLCLITSYHIDAIFPAWCNLSSGFRLFNISMLLKIKRSKLSNGPLWPVMPEYLKNNMHMNVVFLVVFDLFPHLKQ